MHQGTDIVPIEFIGFQQSQCLDDTVIDKTTSQQISDWFDKIIEKNQAHKIFDEEKLIEKKEQAIKNYNKIKNRLFKIKIGNCNLCLSKNLKIYVEKRD